MARRYQPRHGADDSDDPAAKPGTKGGPGTTRRRGAQHASGTTRQATGAARTSQRQARLNRTAEAADTYATRQAYRRAEGKPSVVGKTVAGAAAGTAAGAAVAGPPGAAVGAVVGGAGGAVAGVKAKKAYKLAAHANLGARRVVVAEFMICMIVIALSPLTDKRKQELPVVHLRRLSAVMAVFLILGLVSAMGRGAGKVAAGFGGLVTVAIVMSDRDLFMKIGDLFGGRTGKAVGKADKEPAAGDDLADDMPLPSPIPPGGGIMP